MMPIQNRYDFVLLFDVADGNPNGDPDAGNLPRLDAETGHGITTDVCLKRKVRNYVTIAKGLVPPHDIYVKEKAVLGRAHWEAFKKLGIELGADSKTPVPASLTETLLGLELPDGLNVEVDEEGSSVLLMSGVTDKKEVQKWLKEGDLSKDIRAFLSKALREVSARKPNLEETKAGRDEMCRRFFDIRTFGAVLSLKTAPNCGQVRGPVQLTFGRSVDPVVAMEHSITRMAVATEAEAEKQGGDNRTMGRKHTVPYGLYRAHGFVSAHLAEQTGFSEEDLKLLWEALANMFEHDRSAARGEMNTRGLYVFKHEAKLGNAPAHQLFERITVQKKDGDRPPRAFSDYEVRVNDAGMPAGISLTRVVG
jgi:CRISPR-associated protein Csd2